MLEIKNLSFAYQKNIKILDNISFNIKAGEIVALLGPNGIGKSTLLKCILNLLKVNEGQILINSKNISKISIREKAKYFSYVPQSMNVVFPISILDFILLGANTNNLNKSDSLNKAFEIIEEFNLNKFIDKDIRKVSGGQKQRVYIARALFQKAHILLLDEPTSNLDLKYQKETFETLKRYSKKTKTSIIVSIHDLNLAAKYCDRFILLKDSKIYSDGNLEDTYTKENIENIYNVPIEIINYKDKKIVTLE